MRLHPNVKTVYFQIELFAISKADLVLKRGSITAQLQLDLQNSFKNIKNQLIQSLKMRLLPKITVICAVVTAVLFTQSHAAPFKEDLGILPHPHNYYQGQVQQDPVPDPGFGDWATKIGSSLIAKSLEDRDPKKIEVVKGYIKDMRTLASPATNFIRQFYPDDTVANNIMNALNTYLSSLDKLTEEPSVSHKDTKSLAKLMRTFEAITS